MADERILIDTEVAPDPEAVEWINPRLKAGEVRKVVTGIPGKTGLVYTLDRATGEFLWATPTVRQNVTAGIDGATGEVSLNEEVIFRELEQVMFICPSWAGGKDWEAGAYSPLTRTMYFPLRQACAEMLVTTDFKSEKVKALDQETGEVLWEIDLGAPVMGFPVTYAVSDRQYVAVNTGPGRPTNARMTPELRPGRGSNLFVFALP